MNLIIHIMKIDNFIKLISAITGRDFNIDTDHTELEVGYKYRIYKRLPLLNTRIGFDFKVPKNEESIIKSFITTFKNKYYEPDPAAYDKVYGGVQYWWSDKTDKEKEYAYWHHRSNMYSPDQLLDQIKSNLSNSSIEEVLYKYGFYATNYGIGIFILFSTVYELNAIKRMEEYLTNQNIPFTNEFSDARWVYRFVINVSKDIHTELLKGFNQYNDSINK